MPAWKIGNTVNNLGVALIISVRNFEVHSGVMGSILEYDWMIELNKDKICYIPRICEKMITAVSFVPNDGWAGHKTYRWKVLFGVEKTSLRTVFKPVNMFDEL